MAEYINRAELIENLNKFAPEHCTALVNQLILKQPTADVVEVKHGEWIWNRGCAYDEKQYFCSLCTEGSDMGSDNYCPNCGAKMDGRKKERF